MKHKDRQVVILTESEAALLSEGVRRLMKLCTNEDTYGPYFGCYYCYEGARHSVDIQHKNDCEGQVHLAMLKQLVPDPFDGT